MAKLKRRKRSAGASATRKRAVSRPVQAAKRPRRKPRTVTPTQPVFRREAPPEAPKDRKEYNRLARKTASFRGLMGVKPIKVCKRRKAIRRGAILAAGRGGKGNLRKGVKKSDVC